MLQCKWCEKFFEKPKRSGAGRPPSYCSDACRHEERKAHWRRCSNRKAAKEKQERHEQQRQCLYCLSAFTLSDGNYKYCSEKCANKATTRSKNDKRRAAMNQVDYESPVTPADLALRDGPNCCHCGDMFTAENWGEVDHIIPLSRGGVHAGYNCQLLCSECNNAKGSAISLQDHRKALALWPERPKIQERDPRRNLLSRRIRPYSGYRGVTPHREKWKCKIEFNGRAFRKGGFDTPEDAARHYNFMCDLLGLGPEYQNEVRENADAEKTG